MRNIWLIRVISGIGLLGLFPTLVLLQEFSGLIKRAYFCIQTLSHFLLSLAHIHAYLHTRTHTHTHTHIHIHTHTHSQRSVKRKAEQASTREIGDPNPSDTDKKVRAHVLCALVDACGAVCIKYLGAHTHHTRGRGRGWALVHSNLTKSVLKTGHL